MPHPLDRWLGASLGRFAVLACAALLLGRRRRGWLATAAGPVAWAFTGAALADAIENVPLVTMLRRGVADPAGARVSLVAATIKFGLLVVGGLYLVVAGAALAARSLRSPRPPASSP